AESPPRDHPQHGRRTRREYPAALYVRVRVRRRARRPRGPALWPDLRGAAGDGRADPDPGFRRDRDRRHRVDPRRARRRAYRRHGRYARPRVPQADARDHPLARRGRCGRTGARFDADLPADGAGTRAAARRSLSVARHLMNRRTIILAIVLLLLAATPRIAVAL